MSDTIEIKREVTKTERFEIRLGDCVEELSTLPDASIDYSIFSPPFVSLYTYSDSPRDFGNCAGKDEFFQHMDFLTSNFFRVMKPGRLVSFHCMALPASKTKDGFIGLRDFPGDLIRCFEKAGFHYHSEVCIWKDPVTAMQRTKAIGLLYKQLRKDSCISRQGIADKLITMRMPGENAEPVTKDAETFALATDKVAEGADKRRTWQNYASPVWMDINPSNTLQYASAREDNDERHICPLQLDVIERGIDLWSNPDDLVLSPFAGIGSEGHVALKMGRRFIGFELKESYYRQAVKNLKSAEESMNEKRLF